MIDDRLCEMHEEFREMFDAERSEAARGRPGARGAQWIDNTGLGTIVASFG
jgi:hypothetical protein